MERKRTFCWDNPKLNARDAGSISGLDYLKAIKAGEKTPPPVAMLVGYRICDVDKGYAAFELDPGEYHYNPFSTVHGGVLSTLLDSAMTASVLTTLPKGLTCTTVEIKVNFIRPVDQNTGLIRCEARPIHVGNRLATVEGRIRDTEGRLIAHGVSTCSIFRVLGKGRAKTDPPEDS
ncbi:MAG TPA: PaaI family thioesterase [Desulfobacteria bacterium]|nr:PaaI family thioesterase [Desulfobacteria bacterium]